MRVGCSELCAQKQPQPKHQLGMRRLRKLQRWGICCGKQTRILQRNIDYLPPHTLATFNAAIILGYTQYVLLPHRLVITISVKC